MLSCYAIELKKVVRIVPRIVGVELSKRSLKTGTSSLEHVAGATSVYCPMSSSCGVPGTVAARPFRRSNVVAADFRRFHKSGMIMRCRRAFLLMSTICQGSYAP